jgi:hypothetical protein
MCRTKRPLMWFVGAYIPRLCLCLIVAVYIYFTPKIIDQTFFYPVLVILLCLNEAVNCMSMTARVGFFARVSEPRIAGTYMTFLATISNTGQRLSLTSVLYIANWLPKAHAYSIEVAFCCLFGFIWIISIWPTIKRLDRLPVNDWYSESKRQVSETPPTTSSQQSIADDPIKF